MAKASTPSGFTGFTPEAFGFFADLAKNNNRDWFQAHKAVFERACSEPLKALTVALDPPSGAKKLTRINRDVRFSKDKSPYHTHISGVVLDSFLMLSAEGLYVGAGVYMPEPPVLRRIREAIDANASGSQLEEIVASLRDKGYAVISHESVASAPRGYSADHPRLELLRMKDIHAGKTLGPEALADKKAVDRVRRVCTDVAPLRQWLSRHAGAVSCQ